MSLDTLKIKIVSLAYEAKLIRTSERAAKEEANYIELSKLVHHRKHIIRPESRKSHLVYGFLRGTPYRKMERRCQEEPKWSSLEKMAKRFKDAWTQEDANAFKAWVEEGKKDPEKEVEECLPESGTMVPSTAPASTSISI